MKNRLLTSLLRERLREYPAVALLGPRQCGKTTLARSLAKSYFDAEDEADRVRLDLEWEVLMRGRKLIVIDEAQTWPRVFPRLRGAIDRERGRCGRVLLLGSVSPALMREVSESLAGRLAVLELTPFLHSEVARSALARLWLQGGFPDGGILGGDRFPSWQRNYVTLMVQRDLPAWGLPAKPQVTYRLLQMLTAVHGQIWNASNLGQSLGLSYHTVNSYLDFLEGAYLVRRLPPWNARTTKRLIKSPKVYLRDSGLLQAMWGVAHHEALLRHPMAGASWEGFVIEQLIDQLQTLGIAFESLFLRTSDGYETHLLLRFGESLVAIEIKLSSRASTEDVARLEHCAQLVGAGHRYILCQTNSPLLTEERGVIDLATACTRLTEIASSSRRVRSTRRRI